MGWVAQLLFPLSYSFLLIPSLLKFWSLPSTSYLSTVFVSTLLQRIMAAIVGTYALNTLSIVYKFPFNFRLPDGDRLERQMFWAESSLAA